MDRIVVKVRNHFDGGAGVCWILLYLNKDVSVFGHIKVADEIDERVERFLNESITEQLP